MFFQSLTTGSQQAQVALQRLTTFLENEGTEGRVSPVLQKRILGNAILFRLFLINMLLKNYSSPLFWTAFLNTNLLYKIFVFADVLLTALSDCLAEHPDLLPAARDGLGAALEKLPKPRYVGGQVSQNLIK